MKWVSCSRMIEWLFPWSWWVKHGQRLHISFHKATIVRPCSTLAPFVYMLVISLASTWTGAIAPTTQMVNSRLARPIPTIFSHCSEFNLSSAFRRFAHTTDSFSLFVLFSQNKQLLISIELKFQFGKIRSKRQEKITYQPW